MCQNCALMDKDGGEEFLLENVTRIEVDEDCLNITTLFEGTNAWPKTAIRRIDFATGKVYLYNKA